MARPKGFMESWLFEKIVDECAEGGCRTVHLHNFGEPLLDKKLPCRIRRVKQQTSLRVKIFTNGSLLRGELADGLLESGLDELRVSLDGVDAREFNSLRVGLNYEQVVANLRNFKQMRNRRRCGPLIVAGCAVTANRRRTAVMLADVVDRVEFSNIHNWAGRLQFPERGTIRKPCLRLWQTFTVLVNGDVALCCLDYAGKAILGNCREQSIAEIWNGERYRQLRSLHRGGRQDEIPLCDNCTKCLL
jgi:MoaA/NifB/PqqE/SkfB family radical SAM enzyme